MRRRGPTGGVVAIVVLVVMCLGWCSSAATDPPVRTATPSAWRPAGHRQRLSLRVPEPSDVPGTVRIDGYVPETGNRVALDYTSGAPRCVGRLDTPTVLENDAAVTVTLTLVPPTPHGAARTSPSCTRCASTWMRRCRVAPCWTAHGPSRRVWSRTRRRTSRPSRRRGPLLVREGALRCSGRARVPAGAQWNESPQAQEPVAFGLSIVKPCFSIVSTKSIVAPLRYGDAHPVDDDVDAAEVGDHVAVEVALVEEQLVAQAGAAAGLHGDAQREVVAALLVEQALDLGGGGVGDRMMPSVRISVCGLDLLGHGGVLPRSTWVTTGSMVAHGRLFPRPSPPGGERCCGFVGWSCCHSRYPLRKHPRLSPRYHPCLHQIRYFIPICGNYINVKKGTGNAYHQKKNIT